MELHDFDDRPRTLTSDTIGRAQTCSLPAVLISAAEKGTKSFQQQSTS